MDKEDIIVRHLRKGDSDKLAAGQLSLVGYYASNVRELHRSSYYFMYDLSKKDTLFVLKDRHFLFKGANTVTVGEAIEALSDHYKIKGDNLVDWIMDVFDEVRDWIPDEYTNGAYATQMKILGLM